MKITIRGDKLQVTKAIKNYISDKLKKLNKYFDKPDDIKCSVIIRVKNEKQTIEVTIPTSKFTIRAEESHTDLYAACDLIIDKLDRQIKKNKDKLKKHYTNNPEFEMALDFDTDGIEALTKIVKRKNVKTKPMDEDEAVLQMELLNHDFFAFKNLDEECVSVVYKRKDNSYGILNIK